jgi:hypothetical protein
MPCTSSPILVLDGVILPPEEQYDVVTTPVTATTITELSALVVSSDDKVGRVPE